MPTEMPVGHRLGLLVGDVAADGPIDHGYRYGTLTVTVRHRWGAQPTHVMVEFFPSPGLERTGSGWPPIVTTPTTPWFRTSVEPPPARGATTYTFAFRRATTAGGQTLDVEAFGVTRAGTPISEAIGWNGDATATIRVVD